MKKGWFKKTLFYESIQRTKEQPRLIGMIILFDILFLISIYLLQIGFNIFIPKNVSQIVELFGVFVLFFGFIYSMLTIFAYSFFGYIILHYIKSFVKKERFSFRYVGKYFLLNLFILILGYICMILINLGLKAVRPEFMKFYFWITVIPFLILFLIFVFLSHAVFIEEKNIRKVIRTSFKIMFTEVKKYYGFLLGDAILAIILVIILAILWLLGSMFHGKVEFILRNIISGIILIVFIYAIIVFNRIMFYLGILKKKF